MCAMTNHYLRHAEIEETKEVTIGNANWESDSSSLLRRNWFL